MMKEEPSDRSLEERSIEASIFVQIASYRDPELGPTLDDLLANATHPERLIFGICHQHCADDPFDALPPLCERRADTAHFRILDVPHVESKGVCWARNRIQTELYRGEDYTLQIDSHMRASPGWDVTLIRMLGDLVAAGHAKPLLTAYAGSYNPRDDPGGRSREPWMIAYDRWTHSGVLLTIPCSIPGWMDMQRPVPARFYSAHFTFAPGAFVTEVPHDPRYYFHGEEITIAVRAYTHGYDLFHPHRIVMWHEYTRAGRVKHWDDHSEWPQQNSDTERMVQSLLVPPPGQGPSESGLGTVRTVRQYEEYAGVLFGPRAVHPETLRHCLPPAPGIDAYGSEAEYRASFNGELKRVTIRVPKAQLQEADYDFWAVAVHDVGDQELLRQDASSEDIRVMQQQQQPEDKTCDYYTLVREFQGFMSSKPVTYVVWPHSASKGWGTRLTGALHSVEPLPNV